MTATARMTKAELLKLLGKKDREISRLQRAAKRTRQAEADLASQEDVYRTLVDNLPQKIFLKDTSSRWLSANAGMLADVGMSAEEIRGKRDRDLFPPELADKYTADDQRIVASGETEELEEPYEVDGETIWVHTVKTPVKNDQGTVTGVLGIFWDVTAQRRQQDELVRYRDKLEAMVEERTGELTRAQEALSRQAQEILDLSTPVLQVRPGIVAAPLIGSLDSRRTQQFMERLLTEVVETRSEVAIVDITGVPAVDTQTAQHLLEATQAIRLLGARTVLTGVRPAIAQTLVHLGVDLAEIITRASLADGLAVAEELAARPEAAHRRTVPAEPTARED